MKYPAYPDCKDSGAWINAAIVDHKGGQVGKVGYEINFNRYFYKYQPPRPLEEIEARYQSHRAGHREDVARGHRIAVAEQRSGC